jgi:diguanylate cyclase (GGDEF)-like protein
MKFSFLKTRYVGYLLLLSLLSWFLFNYLLNAQSRIMLTYFIEKPTTYNLERAERLAGSIYQSFKQEVPVPDINSIRTFVRKYNDIPFLSVNFVYRDKKGLMQSVLNDVKQVDILRAEYVYPVNYGNREIGTLLVYDINKEYKKGLEEYSRMMLVTKVFFALILILLFSVLSFREYSTKIENDKRAAEYKAIHDGLTGLFNQKYFKESLEKEISRSKRYKRPVSLIMCDIDYFKKFNDNYGHLSGDKVLKTVADIIQSNVRTFDIVARYGGEEFAVLLMEAGFEEARSVAERLKTLTDQAVEIAGRIKSKVENTLVEIDHTKAHVTLSMGVASYDGHEDYKPEYLISEADHALYESKNNGRNQITIFDPVNRRFIRMDQLQDRS